MKLRHLTVLIFVVFTCLQPGVDPVIRVKAVGLAPPGITPAARARASALRAAKVEGYKKLAEAAGFSKIFQYGKYKHIRVNAFLKGALVVHKRYISDYEVEVVMEIEKKNIHQNKMHLLKREIKTIEVQITSLNRQLGKLKKLRNEWEKNKEGS
jgi:hypothetical protein